MLLPKNCPFNVNLKTSETNPGIHVWLQLFNMLYLRYIILVSGFKVVWVVKHPVRRKLSDILWRVSFGKAMREEQVSVLDPRFPSLYIFNTRNQTHALSLHTQGKVFRLKSSAAPSTTPQRRPAWKAFPQLLCNIFLVACANVSFLMLISLCKRLKRGKASIASTIVPSES